MKYEELFAHIKAKTEVRIARFNVSYHRYRIIGVPTRVFKTLRSGRVRQYVEITTKEGRVHKADLCHVRPVDDVLGRSFGGF